MKLIQICIPTHFRMLQSILLFVNNFDGGNKRFDCTIIQTKRIEMKRSREEFEQKLEEFFERHDDTKMGMAHTLSHRFVNHQNEVFEHLSELYHKREGLDHITETAIYDFSIGGGAG